MSAPWRFLRLENRQPGQVRPVEATVAREKAIGVDKGMCADEEVGQDPAPGAGGTAVRAVDPSGSRRDVPVIRDQLHADAVEARCDRALIVVGADDLRPHDRRNDERSVGRCLSECNRRAGPVLGLPGEDVEQDGGVDRGDQRPRERSR